MEIIRRGDVISFSNSGVTSEQLLFPENSESQRVTITRVTVAPGAKSPRHAHANAEQVWIVLRGHGSLLVADDATTAIGEGDVVRFAEGDVHGFANTSSADFVYLSVTSPPLNFRSAYSSTWK